MTPQRWQRSRKAGAKQPKSCRYVGRGTGFGNMFEVMPFSNCFAVDSEIFDTRREAHEYAVECYVHNMHTVVLPVAPAYYDELMNYEYISCFCPLDLPCHCDAIIEHLKTRQRAAHNGSEAGR